MSAKIKVNCIIKYFYKIINKSAKVNSYRKFHFLVHFPLRLQRDCKQYGSAVSTSQRFIEIIRHLLKAGFETTIRLNI